VRDSAGREEEAAGADATLLALDIDEDLASSMYIASSWTGCRCSGVRFPRTIWSSRRKNTPSVSAAVAFHVNSPPPANHICSPSPSCRMMGTAVLMALLAGAGGRGTWTVQYRYGHVNPV